MTIEEVIDLLKKDKKQRGKCFISDALDIAINVLEGIPKWQVWLIIRWVVFKSRFKMHMRKVRDKE